MKFTIKGMHCKSCKMLIEDVLEDLNVEVINFTFDEAKQLGTLEVKDGSSQEIIDAIQAEGDYTVEYGN